MADERIAWYSQTGKNTVSDTDKLMVYDGSKTYMIPFSAIKNAIPTVSEPDPGTGSTPDPGTGSTNNWYDAVQKLSVNDTDLFPVYDGTDAYVVPISAIRGADNLTDNEVILVEQFRKPLEKTLLEIPAGKLNKNETPITCAHRELEEETGYKAKDMIYLGKIATAPGFCDEIIHLFKATNLYEGKKSN